jgi:hypothetical protein
MVMASCGSNDVTGPSGGEEPDVYDVTLQAEVFNYSEPRTFHVTWLEDGGLTGYDTTTVVWEYDMEGQSGDSLYIHTYGYDGEWMLATIYVDGEWCASSGPPEPGHAKCSYVIP